jgi:hypothetical protein
MTWDGLTQAKLDFSGLLTVWGTASRVTRMSGSLNSTGRLSGSFVAKTSGTLWIQPDAGNYRRDLPGKIEETTHVAFVRKTLDVRSGDRVLPSGDTYEYDVLDLQENPTHNVVMLRRVKR